MLLGALLLAAQMTKYAENCSLFFLPFFQAVSELGLVLYWALDFGLGESEQRTLSKEIEELLEAMVGGNNGKEKKKEGDESMSVFPHFVSLLCRDRRRRHRLRRRRGELLQDLWTRRKDHGGEGS